MMTFEKFSMSTRTRIIASTRMLFRHDTIGLASPCP